ncbi:response regulator [Dokdonia sp. 4H-3-7-5]|uniref:response regulator n=1 Tax=Dokdonia sp. (strain 4H-3-7-5) TaxID=983548 RepID=UPI00020A6B80|nr:response regulator [Dokdonia sp. 4H-3-7-5]AEE18499.1 putative two-component system response regulatory protein [Dokdonia sp. 4H-3-7-5]
MIEFLKSNYEWLFGGIGVTALFFILDKFVFKNKESKPKEENKNVNKNSITIHNNLVSNGTEEKQENGNNESKNKIRILFVDDEHTKFKMVSILKKAGWRNTKSIKDITDLDDYKAKEADIIFVDINGVGRTLFEDQGLGLASALKKKYPQKKIVIYSSETKGDRFHKALREVDDCLSKDAEPYQFVNLIETLCQ